MKIIKPLIVVLLSTALVSTVVKAIEYFPLEQGQIEGQDKTYLQAEYGRVYSHIIEEDEGLYRCFEYENPLYGSFNCILIKSKL